MRKKIKEKSYGIIPLRRQIEEKWEVFIVQHHSGHWAFPKGHAEVGENSKQAAERELMEETGLSVQDYLSEKIFIENYFFTFEKKLIQKTVEYFLASVTGQVVLQVQEINAGRWVLLEEAIPCLTFLEGQKICKEVSHFLQSEQENPKNRFQKK
jgi:bis(5'-nucleosidyl)-tetraphosphatase